MSPRNLTLFAAFIGMSGVLQPLSIMSEDLKTPESLSERISYSYGLVIARQLTERGIEIDLAQFTKAFETILAKGEPVLNEDQVEATFEENRKTLDLKNASDEDKVVMAAGQKFLDENKGKDGVKTTASGLQYEVITPAEGPKPKATDTVTVHYSGWTTDSQMFDSSVRRGEPTRFGLTQVIPGWTEGVQLMSVGGKYRFFIPYDLAYGERGSGADIQPFSTLIFEVELLGIGG